MSDLKMQDFCPRIDMLKENRCILRLQGAPLHQKVQKPYFQGQFSTSKINEIFSKKRIHLRISICPK